MILANKYKILEKIGEGTFSQVFKGENIRTKKLVAIKCEPSNYDTCSLKYETQIYIALNLPHLQIKWFGKHLEFYFLVLPYLGESLNKIKNVSLFQVLELGNKMIQQIKLIHDKGFIHRDIKPANFVLNSETGNLYLIDFGFCRKYLQEDNSTHIPLNTISQIIGTPNFISQHVKNKIEPSRRDDLESVGYIMLYLLDNNENESITQYLNYCKNLGFDETPNYELFKS
jgi:serine/threonine protein kinase